MKIFKEICIVFLLTLLSGGVAKAQTYDVTLESLLDEIVSFESSTYFPDYKCLQQSSYDRRSVTPGNMNWFANDDGSGIIRTETNEGRTEKVLFEDNGAGVITRIWMTTFDRKGTMRFYFDGSTTSSWTIPAYDMLQSGLSLGLGLCQPHINNIDGGKGGSTFFFPIPYNQSCKVTLEEPSADFSTPRYFQFNYRKYDTAKKIQPFSTSLVAGLKSKIQAVDNQLLNPTTYVSGNPLNSSKRIAENESINLNLPSGTKVLKTLKISVSNFDEYSYAQLMRGLIIKAVFDNKETVWVPLCDFSGAGMGAPSVDSWYLSADGKGSITSRWSMPYQTSAEISIINLNNESVDVSLRADVDDYTWASSSLYFYASWKQQIEIPVTNLWENAIDWNFATIEGKGVLRGDVLSLFNRTASWYGEGDEKIYVDNETFPSHFGTGTEDYYNCSWAPVSPFDTPFGGAPRADLESSAGYNTFFRSRNLDAIPFSNKFVFDIEMLSWVAGLADYSTTIYWYGDANAEAKGMSRESEALRELQTPPENLFAYTIPNGIEFETLTPIYKSSTMATETQGMTHFSGFKWSKGKQLLVRNSQVGDYLLYRLEGYGQKKYRIQVQGTKAGDFGILSFSVNGSTPTSIDFYNDGVIHTGAVSIGEYIPQNGVFEIKVSYTGKNSNSSGNLFGLDCIQIIESDFKVTNAIEFENYPYSNISSSLGNFPQEMSFYTNGKWSDKSHKIYVGIGKGDYIDYNFPNLEQADYSVTLYATKGPDFGILAFDVNGTAVAKKFDGYHNLVSDSGPIELGSFAAKNDGSIDLRVNIVGTNAFSANPHYIIGLDCITLEKKTLTGISSQEDGHFYRIIEKKLVIDPSKQEGLNVSIFDLSGRKIVSSNQSPIDMTNLKDDFYILELISDKYNLTTKISLQ